MQYQILKDYKMDKVEEINFKIITKSKKDLDLLNLYLSKNKVLCASLDLYITQKDVDNFECKIKKEIKKMIITFKRNKIDEN